MPLNCPDNDRYRERLLLTIAAFKTLAHWPDCRHRYCHGPDLHRLCPAAAGNGGEKSAEYPINQLACRIRPRAMIRMVDCEAKAPSTLCSMPQPSRSRSRTSTRRDAEERVPTRRGASSRREAAEPAARSRSSRQQSPAKSSTRRPAPTQESPRASRYSSRRAPQAAAS